MLKTVLEREERIKEVQVCRLRLEKQNIKQTNQDRKREKNITKEKPQAAGPKQKPFPPKLQALNLCAQSPQTSCISITQTKTSKPFKPHHSKDQPCQAYALNNQPTETHKQHHQGHNLQNP